MCDATIEDDLPYVAFYMAGGVSALGIMAHRILLISWMPFWTKLRLAIQLRALLLGPDI